MKIFKVMTVHYSASSMKILPLKNIPFGGTIRFSLIISKAEYFLWAAIPKENITNATYKSLFNIKNIKNTGTCCKSKFNSL